MVPGEGFEPPTFGLQNGYIHATSILVQSVVEAWIARRNAALVPSTMRVTMTFRSSADQDAAKAALLCNASAGASPRMREIRRRARSISRFSMRMALMSRMAPTSGTRNMAGLTWTRACFG
jgi:hypothetical protein